MSEGGWGSGFRGFGSTEEQGNNTFGRGVGTSVRGPGSGGWGRGGGSSSSDASVVFGKDNSNAKLNANSRNGFGSSQFAWNRNSAGSDLSSSSGGFGGGNRPSGFKSIGAEPLITSGATSFGKATGNGNVGGSAPRFGFGSSSSSSLRGGDGTFRLTTGMSTTPGEFGAASFSDGGSKSGITPSQRVGGFGVTPQASVTRDFGSTFTQLKQGGSGFGTESSNAMAYAASGIVGDGGEASFSQPTFGTKAVSSKGFGVRKTFDTVAAASSNSIAAQQPSTSAPPPGHSYTATGPFASGSSSSGKHDYSHTSLRGDESDKVRIMGMTASETESMKASMHQAPRAGFLGSSGGGNGSDLKLPMYEKRKKTQEQNSRVISEGVEGVVAGGAVEVMAEAAASEEGTAAIGGVQVEWERRDFADAVALIGRNELMCSPKEVEERIRMDDLRMLEREHVNHRKSDGTPYLTHEMAIKKFKRVTPGTRKDDPAEVRTPKALHMTMDYLEDEVIPKGSSYVWGGKENDPRIEDAVARMKWDEESASDEVDYEVYKYVWDRTREIRGDYSMQGFQMAVGRLDSIMDLSVFERIARWHICMDHRLHGNVAYDRGNNAAQNLEQLKATFGSLLELYCVARSKVSADPKEFTSPHEAELCSYHLLLNLDQDGGSMALSLVQEWLDNAPEVVRSIWVKRALKVLVARKNGNFAYFFSELSTAPYLFRCCLFMYVSSERSQALRCLQATRTYPLDDLIDLLAFQSRGEAMDFVTAHGLEVDANNDVLWFSSKGERMLVKPSRLPVALKMEATIEAASRGFGIKDIIHGKALPKDGPWGKALHLSSHGGRQNNNSSLMDNQNHEEQAMQARAIEILKRQEKKKQQHQKKKDEEAAARLVELERVKRLDAEWKAKEEAKERAKKALYDVEERRLKALRLQEEKEKAEKERLLMLEKQAVEEAKYLLKQKELADKDAAERAARALEQEKRLAQEAEERRRKELQAEKEKKEAEERRRREAEERLRKAAEIRREAERRAQLVEDRRQLKLAVNFCSRRMLSFAVNVWHSRAEETTNLWRLEFSRRKRNRDAIALTDISLMGQPLLKRILATSGDLIVSQSRMVAAAPVGLDGGELDTMPPPRLEPISQELPALAIARSLPSSTPSEPTQLFRILVIHSESTPLWFTSWLDGCLGIHGRGGVVVGEVMCTLSSGGGRVYTCARKVSMKNDEMTTWPSLVEQHSAVASAAVFTLNGAHDSVFPTVEEEVAPLLRTMDSLPEGIPVALLIANEGKRLLQHHKMRERFLSLMNGGSTKICRHPRKIFAMKNGDEQCELQKVLEFLAVNVPPFLRRPIVIGRPAQDVLEHCIDHALWRSTLRHSHSNSSPFSTAEQLLTDVRSAVTSLAKLYDEESSTNILSGWPPDEFASAEGKNGKVIENGGLLEGSGPIGEPSLRVGALPVHWRMESARVFQKAIETLTLSEGISDDNVEQQFRGSVASQIELGCIKKHSSTLLALESQLRAKIQDALVENDLVYCPSFNVNLWFEDEEERLCDKKIVVKESGTTITAAASLENNARVITSLDPVSHSPPRLRALDDAPPLTVATVQLCDSLQKQHAVRRGHLNNAVLKNIQSVSRDNQRLIGALQKCCTRSSNTIRHAVPTSGGNTTSTCSGVGATPIMGDIELMIHGIREERKASENTEKRLKAAIGGWRSARC